MSSINKQEYLILIKELLEQQYNNSEDTEYEEDSHWIPSESPLKDKLSISVLNGTMDLTKAKKERIVSAIKNASSFTVDHFLVKISRNLFDSNNNAVLNDHTLNIEIFEERFKTPSGNPCRITYRVDIGKDSRFTQCKWASQFGSRGNSARNITNDTFIEIIRLMQALKRLTVFL